PAVAAACFVALKVGRGNAATAAPAPRICANERRERVIGPPARHTDHVGRASCRPGFSPAAGLKPGLHQPCPHWPCPHHRVTGESAGETIVLCRTTFLLLPAFPSGRRRRSFAG